MTAVAETSENFVQRREAFRLKLRLRVMVNKPFVKDCELIDISELGACFDVEFPCTPGCISSFTIVLPNQEQLQLRGTVVRIDDKSTAVQFCQVSKEIRAKLKQLMQQEQLRLLRARRNLAEDGSLIL